jgi:hypothetical protein
VGTAGSGALPASGWYPDPYRRWKARYWDGRLWTEQVAAPGPDPKLPVFGHDAVALPARADLFVVDATLARLVDAVCSAELAYLRAEVETWRSVADARGRALERAFDALESLGTASKQLSTEPNEHRVEPVDRHAAESARATVTDPVRLAELSELLTMRPKQRRWWRRS